MCNILPLLFLSILASTAGQKEDHIEAKQHETQTHCTVFPLRSNLQPIIRLTGSIHMMEPPLKRVLMTDGVIPKGQEEGKLGQTQLSVSSICRPKGCNVQLSIRLLPYSSIPQLVIHLNATIYYRRFRDIPLLRSSRD